MSKPDVLAIIPVYHKYEQRDRCLAALAKQTVPIETFIHDNSTENLGYTKACNRGLREALKRGMRFAMVLNQDCYPEPDAVETLVKFMDEHPRCAIAGPMQVSAEDPQQIINAGGKKAYPFGMSRAGTRSDAHLQRAEQIAWVNGACMFVRMEAVVEFGVMDESMFLIGSDSDWSLTARMRGWECWYCPAVVLHEGGVSHAWPSEQMTRIFHQDMSYFRRKWLGTVMLKQLDRPMDEPHLQAPVPNVMQQAIADHGAGRLVEAEVAYRDVLEVEPNNADALNLLGVIELQHGMPMTAHDLFRRAIEIMPTHAQFHSHLATALVSMNRQDEAVKAYMEAVRLETRAVGLIEGIATELTKMGRSAEAAEARAKAASLRQPR
jgi:GT2 family glycosyltransferase